MIGTILPAWFDVFAFANLSNSKQDDEAGILQTVSAVDNLIQAEVDSGIPEGQIVLGGFSQGGAISAFSALRGKRALAGFMALSAWLPLSHQAAQVNLPGCFDNSGYTIPRHQVMYELQLIRVDEGEQCSECAALLGSWSG